MPQKAKSKSDTAIADILKSLPSDPGVYQFLDEKKNIIYIGKAKNLKKRVKSYFLKQKNISPKTEVLVKKIKDIKIITVESETEALILETNLIKQYRPRYNVLMKDDKSYVYLKISVKDDFPRIYTVRRMQKDGNVYFGPYLSSYGLKQILNDLNKVFPYRTCRGEIHVLKESTDPDKHYEIRNVNIPRVPCLQYHIKRCGAPCLGIVSKEEYREVIDHILSFFRGNTGDYAKNIKIEMEEASKNREYEKAVKLRDKLSVLSALSDKQQVVSTQHVDMDVIGQYLGEKKGIITLFQIRNGKMITSSNKSYPVSPLTTEEELIELFIKEYYEKAAQIPKEIVIAKELEFRSELEMALTNTAKRTVSIVMPQRGFKNNILKLACKNAQLESENELAVLTGVRDTNKAMKELAQVLGIKSAKHIECYDISHIQGTNKVGSMVVFRNGRPDKALYKRFKIKTLPEGVNDDFASMTEVLLRRIEYLREQEVEEQKRKNTKKQQVQEDQKKKNKKGAKAKDQSNDSFAIVPDVIILDGGKGQLNTVVRHLESLKFTKPLNIIALAKKKEEIFIPGKKESIQLEETHPARLLIQRIRDEAHRFAVSYHKNLRTKQMVTSVLDDVPGIGKTKKKELIRKFGSVVGIKKADNNDIDAIIGEKLRKVLREHI